MKWLSLRRGKPHLAPHPERFAPRGGKPFAFPRTPFAASASKASPFADNPLNSYGLRSAPAAELRQPLHSRPQCSGALGLHFALQKSNLARPLRARRRPPRTKRVWADSHHRSIRRPANRRSQNFTHHLGARFQTTFFRSYPFVSVRGVYSLDGGLHCASLSRRLVTP